MILQNKSFYNTAKGDFVSGAYAPNKNIHPDVGTHLPTELNIILDMEGSINIHLN